MPVSIPVNGNKCGTADTFPLTRRYPPFFAERTVQAVLILKYPYFVPGQKTYNAHEVSIVETALPVYCRTLQKPVIACRP
jgi:hypothetical protein